MASTITVKVQGDASEYISEMKVAIRATQQMGKQADRAAAKVSEVGTKSKKTAREVDRVGKAAQAAGGRFGELHGRAEAAAAAFGPMGVVIGATVVALTAGAAAVEMGTAAIDLTRHLGDITDRADELAALGAGLDDDDIQAIRDANQALDTLSATFDRLLVVVGTDAGFVGAMKRAAGAANGFFLLLEKNQETVQAFREDAKTLLMVLSGGYAQFDRIVGTVAAFGIDRLNQGQPDLQKTQERNAHLARNSGPWQSCR